MGSLIEKASLKTFSYKFVYRDVNGVKQQKTVSTGVKNCPSYRRKAEKEGERLEREFKERLAQEIAELHKSEEYTHRNDTIDEYTTYWIETITGSLEPNTLTTYTHQLIKARQFLGKKKIKDITKRDVEHFIDSMFRECERCKEDEEPTYFRSIKKYYGRFRAMIKFAYEQGDIDEDCCAKVSSAHRKKIAKAATRDKIEPPTDDELTKILSLSEGKPIHSHIVFSKMSGMRREESLGLRWKNVDLDNEIIKVRDTRVKNGTKVLFRENRAKNQTSLRDVPMADGIKEFLLELKRKHEAEREFYGEGYDLADYGFPNSEFVFINPDGTLPKPDWVCENYRDIVRQVITDRKSTYHDLRHYFATKVYEQTHDVMLVSKLLGHKSIKTTLDIYTFMRDSFVNLKIKGLKL